MTPTSPLQRRTRKWRRRASMESAEDEEAFERAVDAQVAQDTNLDIGGEIATRFKEISHNTVRKKRRLSAQRMRMWRKTPP